MAKNGHGAVGDRSFLVRSGFLITGAELLGILDDALALVCLAVEPVVAVAEDGTVAVGIRGGAETGVDGSDKVLLTSESAAMGHFLDREAFIVEQVDGLQHAPLQDELLEGNAYEELHRLVQVTLIDVEEDGDFLCGMSLYLLDIIDDGIDGDLSGGSSFRLVELLDCGDLFDQNHTFLFLRVYNYCFCHEFANYRIRDEEMLRTTNSLGNSLSGAALYPAPPVWGGGGELSPDYFLQENLSRSPSPFFFYHELSNYRIILAIELQYNQFFNSQIRDKKYRLTLFYALRLFIGGQSGPEGKGRVKRG